MLKEGLANRILKILGEPPISPEEKEKNHQRYGKMLDRYYQQQIEFDKKTRAIISQNRK